MYWQPTSILKCFNFLTSSCSLSPTLMEGIPFPFPNPSIVNTFLRRTAFSPNREIFAMRPNKMTRCIFWTKVRNECRIDNNETIYKAIHEIEEKHFKATNHSMHKQVYDARAYTSSWYPTEEWGNLREGTTGDRICGMILNIFADSAWNDGNRRNKDVWLTGAFTKPANPPIGFYIFVRLSVHLHVTKSLPLVGFTWNLISESLLKIFREIPDWL